MTSEAVYLRLLQGRVPQKAEEKLAHYAAMLDRWAKKQSLVRVKSPEELVDRHLLESLRPLPLLEPQGKLLDIGSGAGLPGLPLLCVLTEWKGVLLEPRRKRWAFLRQVIRELGLAVEARLEGFEEHEGFDYSAICSRALRGQRRIASWARSHLSAGGSVFFWATNQEEEELRGLSGWSVLGFPIDGLERGRLIQMGPRAGLSGS